MSKHSFFGWSVGSSQTSSQSSSWSSSQDDDDDAYEEYLERIEENTRNFSGRYRKKLDDLVSQGLDAYMPGEFAKVREQLDQVDELVANDPESARDLNMEVGRQLSVLPGLARAAQREFEAKERQRRRELAEMRRQAAEQAWRERKEAEARERQERRELAEKKRQEAERAWQEQREAEERERQRRQELAEKRREAAAALNEHIHNRIAEIQDPVEMDFAYDEVRAILDEYQGKTVEPGELEALKASLDSRFSAIRNAARSKAGEWKGRQAKSLEKEANEELINTYEEQIRSDFAQNRKMLDAALANISTLKEQIGKNGINSEELKRKVLETTARKTGDGPRDEESRRTVVRSIVETLERVGFVVSKPKRHAGEGSDEVVISARKPAGSEATFSVTLDGKLLCKFDNYEGMMCQKDIDKVLPLLQDAYGVKLSDERVLWQNPDRISKDAKPMDEGRQRNG